MLRRNRLLCFLLVFALLLTSCYVTDATISAAKKATVKTKSLTLQPKGTGKIVLKDASSKMKYTFKSANKKIATVTNKGKVTGIKPGKTTITVSETYKKKTRKVGTVKVTVKTKVILPSATPGSTVLPTASPIIAPTASPSAAPSSTPTVAPKATPTATPRVTPTPTVAPTATPSPTPRPTLGPGFDANGRLMVEYGTATIDGEVDSSWSKAIAIKPNLIRSESSVETSVEYKVMWDDTAMYVLAIVNDKKLDKTSTNVWEQDSIEFYLDENNSKLTAFDDADDDVQVRVNYSNETSLQHGKLEKLVSATKTTSTGYVVEMKVSFEKPVANGQEMGTEIQLNEAADGVRVAQMNIFDDTDTCWQNPSLMGRAILKGKP